MNRKFSFALLIAVGCMLWGCSSETQNPVSSDTPVREELTALHKTSPGPPGNLQATVNDHTVIITWTPPPGVTALSYHVAVSPTISNTVYYYDTTAIQLELVNVPSGSYTVKVSAKLENGGSTDDAITTFVVIGVLPPTVTVTASPVPLCPRNGKWVTVTFSGVVTNTEGGASYELKDEYRKIHYTGTVAAGPYSVKLKLKDSRKGYDRDGRQYTFTITATNSAGMATASVTVTIPREKKQRGWNDNGDDDNDDNDDDWGNN